VTELVGREEELELLLRRWSKAKSGEGQVVLLSGEPGIGKPKFAGVIPIKLRGYQRACHARGKHTGNELTGGAKRRGPRCAEGLAHRHVSANSSV
jgi:predicted ATP-dependent serine protease